MKVTRRTNARAVSKALKLSLGDMKAVRNEGYKDGYARGLEDAARVAATFAPPGGYDTNTFGGVAAMKAGDDIAAAIRKLGEDK